MIGILDCGLWETILQTSILFSDKSLTPESKAAKRALKRAKKEAQRKENNFILHVSLINFFDNYFLALGS